MPMKTVAILSLTCYISAAALSLGFDVNINCVRACDSIHECSGDPSTHTSYCKYWQDPPICFGIYQRPDGSPCFQPADPSCDDRVLAMLGCDGNIAYPPGVSTYPSHSTLPVGMSSTITPSSLRGSTTASTGTSGSADTTVMASTVPLATSQSSLGADEVVTTGGGLWTTTERTGNNRTIDGSTAVASTPQISPTSAMPSTVGNGTSVPRTSMSEAQTTPAVTTVEPRSTITLPEGSDAFTTFGVGTVILYPSN